MSNNSGLVLGIEQSSVPDLPDAIYDAQQAGYSFVVAPLAHPRNQHRFVTGGEPFTRSDLLLPSSHWTTSVVGKTSPWIDPDATDVVTSRDSTKALHQELMWAIHLSLPACIIPTPELNCNNYARTINQFVQNLNYLSIWVRVPLSSGADDDDDVETDPWERWNALRMLTESHNRLFPAIEITANLPSDDVLNRWLGEPIRAAILPTKIFSSNKSGYPTLSRRHQQLIFKLFTYNVQFIIKGNPKHKDGYQGYCKYIKYLWNNQPQQSDQERFESPYWDYLQAPLQPLMDNLESQTYETFEKDPVKYDQYEKAVFHALIERFAEGEKVVLMVVGAGRGPLVRASLRASEAAKRPLKVYAVEKNPNAVVTLTNLKEQLNWGDMVTIVDSDMRMWQAPEKADILVSELLGSFGDNELSPECLDGAQRFLKEDGISIPSSYTSSIAPISTQAVWNDVKAYNDLKHFETAYVVKFHNSYLFARPQDCFTFEHPTPQPADNTRFIKLQFKTASAGVLHGFAGYFDATLYKNIHISIHPETFSVGMFSWFPLFFPLRTPIYVPANSTLEVNFWRNCTPQKVWYEWAVTQPSISPIHNPCGRSYWIGL